MSIVRHASVSPLEPWVHDAAVDPKARRADEQRRRRGENILRRLQVKGC